MNPAPKVMPSSVSIERLSKTFRGRQSQVQVLRELTLEVEPGEMLVLLGPSGCGKTTLLRCIAGLERADEGAIRLGGKAVFDATEGIMLPPERRNVGMVFQNYALWPHMTVQRNVEFPLRARGSKSALEQGHAAEALAVVQCSHLADRYPPQLSGGQQQRVSLARALASRPGVLLLDEPLSNLDALLRIELRAQLRQLHRSVGFTGIYVTHDQIEALNLGTRVVVMREGRIEQIGAPHDIYKRPANEYVADFLGKRNCLPCTVVDGRTLQVAGSTVQLGDLSGSSAPGEYNLRLRASEVLLRPAHSGQAAVGTGWVVGGRIVDVLPSGDFVEYVVELAGHKLFVEVAGDSAFDKDTQVDVGFNCRGLLLYDKSGRLAGSPVREVA